MLSVLIFSFVKIYTHFPVNLDNMVHFAHKHPKLLHFSVLILTVQTQASLLLPLCLLLTVHSCTHFQAAEGSKSKIPCRPCKKTFANQNAYDNHIKSKKHMEVVVASFEGECLVFLKIPICVLTASVFFIYSNCFIRSRVW